MKQYIITDLPEGLVNITADQLLEIGAETPQIPVEDATNSAKGILKLAGDLGGTAENPTVPALANIYTKAEVNAKLSAVYISKGSVNTYADLLALTGQEIGWVWNVKSDGENYSYVGVSTDFPTGWDDIGGVFDVSGKEDKSNKGVANGYAPLDADKEVPLVNINKAVRGSLKLYGEYNGTVISSAIEAALNGTALPTASTSNTGWMFKVITAFSTFSVGDMIVSSGSQWYRIGGSGGEASSAVNKYSQFFSPKQLIAWDNFDRANVNPIVQAESGQLYSAWKGVDIGKIENKVYKTNSATILRESALSLTIPETKNIGIEFAFMRTTAGHTPTGISIVKDLNNYFFFGQISNATNSLFTELPVSVNYQLIAVIAGVATVLGSISQYGVYPNNSGDGFAGTRMTWVARYTNRGRGDRSTFIVQSLDKPSERIEVEVTAYNSTFLTPADYSKIALITGSNTPVNSYNIANIDL